MPTKQRDIDEAHRHLARVAIGLQHVLGPDEAADLLLTAAVTVVLEHHGQEPRPPCCLYGQPRLMVQVQIGGTQPPTVSAAAVTNLSAVCRSVPTVRITLPPPTLPMQTVSPSADRP
jgi:hypothetical protein